MENWYDYMHITPPAYVPVHLHPAGHILSWFLNHKNKKSLVVPAHIESLVYILWQGDQITKAEIYSIFKKLIINIDDYRELVEYKHKIRDVLQDYSNRTNEQYEWVGDSEKIDYIHNHVVYRSRFDVETISWLIETAKNPEASVYYDYIISELIPKIIQKQPKVIWCTIADKQQAAFVMVLAWLLKWRYKEVITAKIGIGGYLPTINKGELLLNPKSEQLFDYLDFCIHWEWEKAINWYIDYLDNKIALDKIPKLIYQNDNKIVANSLDQDGKIISSKMSYNVSRDIVMPDYKTIHQKQVRSPTGDISLVMARWCKYRCSFCAIPSAYDKTATIMDNLSIWEKESEIPWILKDKKLWYWLWRQPLSIGATATWIMIKKLSEQSGANVVSFSDERMDPNDMRELAHHLIDNDIEVVRSAYNTLDKDFMDDEFLDLISRAGFRFPQFWLEAISKSVLKATTKWQNIKTLSQQKKIFEKCVQHNIRPHIFLMIGLAQQSSLDLVATLTYLSDIGDSVLTIKPTTVKVSKASMDAIHSENVGLKLKEAKDFGTNIAFEHDQDNNKWLLRISRNLADSWKIIFDLWIALRHKYNLVTKQVSYTQRLWSGLENIVAIAEELSQQKDAWDDLDRLHYDGEPFERWSKVIDKALKKVIHALIIEQSNSEESLVWLFQVLIELMSENELNNIIKKYVHRPLDQQSIKNNLEKKIFKNDIDRRSYILQLLEQFGKSHLQNLNI